MIFILRYDPADICVYDKIRALQTTSSQVSLLTSNKTSQIKVRHFLTKKSNPKQPLFKPFIFSKNF